MLVPRSEPRQAVRRSGPAKVTLASHGATVPPQATNVSNDTGAPLANSASN